MIACVCLTYFAARVERRADTALTTSPLVLGGQPWASTPLYGFSQEAAWQGIRPGMALRQAHVLFPSATFMEATPPRYAAASDEVHHCLTDFTGKVEQRAWWQGSNPDAAAGPALGRRLPAMYWLDLGSLPQKEIIPLAQQIGRTVRQTTGLDPSIGVAACRWTAQVAAAVTHPGCLLPLAAEREKPFLARRSLHFLPLGRPLRRQLAQLGIHTLGQLAALPLAALQDRFGPAIAPVYRLAAGEDRTPILPLPEEPRLTMHRYFSDPVANRLSLEAVLADLARELAGQLYQRGLMAQTVTLSGQTETGETMAQTLTLRRPVREARGVQVALNDLFRAIRWPAPLTHLAIVLTDLTPAQAEQLSLFPVAAASRPIPPQVLLSRYARYTVRGQLVAPTHPLLERRFVWCGPAG